ncbi:MAG: hypothetical protein D6766_07785 [Verrucomicrobia bacterium]|nr:MAG: hypothetical protein D6766_07785 [Verrucomicrobiota bacterium]
MKRRPDSPSHLPVFPESNAPDCYPLDVLAELAELPRRRILLYCRHGFLEPTGDPDAEGWRFDVDALRRIRRLEHWRVTLGLNMRALKVFAEMYAELERLREEVRFLRGI